MKKTYISPDTKVTKVQIANMLLTLSATDKAAQLGGTSGAYTVDMESRENNSWDIWGNDDYED